MAVGAEGGCSPAGTRDEPASTKEQTFNTATLIPSLKNALGILEIAEVSRICVQTVGGFLTAITMALWFKQQHQNHPKNGASPLPLHTHRESSCSSWWFHSQGFSIFDLKE